MYLHMYNTHITKLPYTNVRAIKIGGIIRTLNKQECKMHTLNSRSEHFLKRELALYNVCQW